MTDTTWTSTTTSARFPAPPQGATLAGMLTRFWAAHVLTPLHRALDSALRAGELGSLNSNALDDIGYRRV
jgi:hypothetical protein